MRLTGGEPTLRRDLVEIAAAVAGTPGVKRVALSTNGARLLALADAIEQLARSPVLRQSMSAAARRRAEESRQPRR